MSEDQNLSLLVILLSIKIFKGHLLPILLFSTSQMYRIYSIKRPGRLFNFWTFRVGAYSRWALNRSWALFKFSPFLLHLIYTFLRSYDDNEVSVKVTGSKTLENGLVLPGTFKTRTPNRAIDTKFEREILWAERTLRPHWHFSENFEENSNVVIKFSDNETRDCKPLKKYCNNQYPYSSFAHYYF